MSNDVNVKPTPIQRNRLDVAIELTQLHMQSFGATNEDYIKKAFAEYYSLVYHLERTAINSSDKLKEFLPEDTKKNIY